MCSQSGEPGLGAQARLGTVTHSGQLQARAQWPSAARSRHGSTELCQQVMITAFEPTCSPVLISPATQGIEVQSQNQTHFSQSPYSDPRCALDLPDNKRPVFSPLITTLLSRMGNYSGSWIKHLYYRCSHRHIHEQISCKAAYLWRSPVSQLKMHFLKHSCLLSIP